LFGRLLDPEPVPADANVLRLMLEPGPVRRSVLNWDAVVPALIDRARSEAVGGVLDADTATLVRELSDQPEVAALLRDRDERPVPVPVLDVRFAVDGVEISFFSVVSTIGAPFDVTAQELRLEAFFPSRDEARRAWLEMVTPRVPPL
jgi:hypothetical protein